MITHSPDDPADIPCSICGTPREQFNDRPNRPRSTCPTCYSVERHRAFAHAYRDLFADAEGFKGARVLMMRPDHADKVLVKELGAVDVVTFDAMPRGAPDVVGDPTAMEFGDSSFDIVVATGALTTVVDYAAVIREIARVLKPTGVAFVYESSLFSKPTVEITDRERQAAWYGAEALDEYGVGQFRSWGLRNLELALAETFAVQLLETVELASSSTYVWCVAAKADLPEEQFTDRSLFYSGHSVTAEFREPPPYSCTLCNAEFDEAADSGYCPACRAPVRARSMPEMVREHLVGFVDREVAQRLPLLGFAMVLAEEQTLWPVFSSFTRVSLYGDYTEDNIKDVDARDLSRFEDGSFSGVLAVGVFDFFVEQDAALAEAFRVLAPGGALMVLFLPYRLRDGGQPPVATSIVTKVRDDDYIPEGAQMDSIVVGRRWYLDAMVRAGFEAKLAKIFDPATGVTSAWFLGRKPA